MQLKKRQLIGRSLLFISSVLFTVFTLEGMARWLTDRQLLSYYQPLHSKIDPATEDWRWTHTFDDSNFTADYQLFWRPINNRFPFDDRGNAQSEEFVSFRTSPEEPKILVYGDSNTQGLSTTSWANQLQLLLLSHQVPIEVMNRGVVGYSSYQGVQRLKKDLQMYKPKIVIFSFGWNDVAPSANAPDPFFKPYPRIGGDLFALSRAYGVGVFYSNKFLRSRDVKPPPTNYSSLSTLYQPRMTIDLYVQEFKEMYVLTKQHGAEPLILSRPFNTADEDFSDPQNWRSRVPAYNNALRQLMRDDRAHFVDLEAYFIDKPQFLFDECHFIPEGHRVAAQLLFEHMLEFKLL